MNPTKPLNYGGQAIIEGVMMRGEREWAACVRSPSGRIVTRREELPAALYRSKVLKYPFLRGLVMLWDSLGLGMRALMWSADVSLGEDSDEHFSGPAAWGTIALSLILGTGLFVLLPTYLVSLLDRAISSAFWSNLAEGGLRLALFVGYLAVIGRMSEIRRVFAYHGAEHKTINAYEAGAPLEPDSVARYSRVHVRCGTGFLLIVLVVFVLVSSLIGRPSLPLRFLSRLVLVPIVSGISYELLKLSARYWARSRIVRALVAPGLLLQRLTTCEPEPAMLEVSIAALCQVLESEGRLQPEVTVADIAPVPTEPPALRPAANVERVS